MGASAPPNILLLCLFFPLPLFLPCPVPLAFTFCSSVLPGKSSRRTLAGAPPEGWAGWGPPVSKGAPTRGPAFCPGLGCRAWAHRA
eukprot:6646630-Lingulodinium_polyedra.AAC.1